jgi:biopolymer transport protein ExbB
MQFDLAHIWASMGALAKGIAAVLLVMAIASAGVTVERMIVLAKSRSASRKFATGAAPLLARWDLEGLVKLAETHKASALARLFTPILSRYLTSREGNLGRVELARAESERTLEGLGAELRRGLGVLASVGSVAPFVGLLGTVIGIIGAFQGIAATGSGGLGSVSAGIAEALIETAFGLMVAIPAVLCFHWLTGRINAVELTLTRSAGELLDDIENNHGREGASEEARPQEATARRAA